MNLNIGFIGAGNMGDAMIRNIIKSNNISSENIYVFDTDKIKPIPQLNVLYISSSLIPFL